MSFTPNFSVVQSIGVPSIYTVADTSVGSDVLITSRRVYTRLFDGTYLLPTGITTDYVSWDIADASIDIDALDKDYAVTIRVDWLNVSNNVLYTKTGSYYFSYNDYLAFYGLTQNLAANPKLFSNPNFYQNYFKLIANIEGGANAVSMIGDIYSGQAALDRATYIAENQNLFY